MNHNPRANTATSARRTPAIRTLAAFTTLALAGTCLCAADDRTPSRIIALTGTDGPKGPALGPDVTYFDFQAGGVRADGTVAYKARLAGPGINFFDNSESLWAERSGTPALVAREGDQVPGALAGTLFQDFFGFSIDPQGRMAFNATTRGATINNFVQGYFTDIGSVLRALVLTGQPAPGLTPTTLVSAVGVPAVGPDGTIAFPAVADPFLFRSTIYLVPPGGSPSLLAVGGGFAPGLSGGELINTAFYPQINDAGDVSFAGSLRIPTTPFPTFESVLYTGGPAALAPLIVGGASLPGLPPGATLDQVADSNGARGYLQNNAFQPAYFAFITDANGQLFGTLRNAVLSTDSLGLPRLVAVEDEATTNPNLPAFIDRDILTADGFGRVSFVGQSGAGDQVIWTEAAAPGATPNLRPLVRTADAVPEIPGATFTILFEPVSNAAGQVVFAGAFEGPGVSFDNNFAFFITDTDGSTRILVRQGDTINLGLPGNWVATQFFALGGDFSSGQNGLLGPIAADGQVLFVLTLLNTADPNEPSINALVLMGADAPCPADLTGDGQVDSGDLQAFIVAFLALSPIADLTNDGQVDSGDLALFINLFLAGC